MLLGRMSSSGSSGSRKMDSLKSKIAARKAAKATAGEVRRSGRGAALMLLLLLAAPFSWWGSRSWGLLLC